MGVTGELHEGFPLRVAREPGLPGACIAGRRRGAGRVAADGEPLEQPAVETHIELLGPAHAHDVGLILAAQTHLDQILAVDREVIRNGETAT